jgi:alpha-galactosidase
MATTTPKEHETCAEAAGQQRGLPGKMRRPLKVVVIGAGSEFTPKLMNDVLMIPGAERGEIGLVDVDTERLAIMRQLIERLIALRGKTGWRVAASPRRRKVMRGAHYLVNTIEVSGLECVRFDNDIPLRYGVDQCIGDTIGPGGLFKGLRTIPVWLQILRDAEELCPDALVLNYTNPMSIMCLAAGRASTMTVLGLCHSVQGTSRLLARRAGVPFEKMDWECAGINHLAWFTKLEHKGRDLYPFLKRKAQADLQRAFREGPPRRPRRISSLSWELPEWQRDLVRKDIMLHFGAFPTESSGHLSEYVPYYRKRADLLRKYCRPGYEGGSSFYADNWPRWRRQANADRQAMLTGKKPVGWKRTWEYASWIIEAREKGVPFRFHGNVTNTQPGKPRLISNLQHDGCVEVECVADGNGVHPLVFGKLPAQLAALCQSNMWMFDLAATAAIERSKEAAIHALMLDPLTAAVCSPAEIKKMTLELFAAEKKFLKGYR